MISKQKIKELEQKLGVSFDNVELDINKRWENGIQHHPESVKIVQAMSQLDGMLNSYALDINIGGDGDNGEAMMYLLDVYFEGRDKKRNPRGFGYNV